MYNYLIYLIKVSILILIFLGTYQLFFRSIKLFHFNRAFLLAGITLSWIIPLINIPLVTGGVRIFPELLTSTFTDTPAIGQSIGATTSHVPVSGLDIPGTVAGRFPWWIIYWIGVFLFTVRGLIGIAQIISIRIKNPATRNHSITYITGSKLPAFSFFRWIFLDEGKYAHADYRMVIDHELAHVRQWHTLDLFLAELVHIILWFNPILIIYKKSLKECHEYLADEAIIKGGTPLADYARSLHNEALARANQKLASYFEGSSLKRRLLMAIKQEKPHAGFRYLLIIPVLLGGLLLFSCNEKLVDLSSGKTNLTNENVILVDSSHVAKDSGAVNQDIELNKKSRNSFIFPVRQDQMSRISKFYSLSTLHPILKVKRPHHGLDICAPIGTPVLASDNGVVAEISNSKASNGFGMFVRLRHSNGYETFYAHLNKALVEENAVVTKGQIIGEVGNTGLAIEPQVHFEIRKNGTAVDPAGFVLPKEVK